MSIRVSVTIAFAVTLAPILLGMSVASGIVTGFPGLFELPTNPFNPGRITATVFSPGGPCAEDVHLMGHIQLVTDVRQQKSGLAEIALFINLVGEGKGALTGARYLATGTVRKDVATPTLPTSMPIQAIFDFVPFGPCRLPRPHKKHLSIRFKVGFDAAGNLSALGIPDNGIFD